MNQLQKYKIITKDTQSNLFSKIHINIDNHYINYYATLMDKCIEYRIKFEKNLNYEGHLCILFQKKYGYINKLDWFNNVLKISFCEFEGWTRFTATDLLILHEKLRKLIF